MLLGTLGANLLGNLLIGKGAIATSQGWGIYRAGKGKGFLRTGYGNNNNNNSNNNNSKMVFFTVSSFN